jgi:hypothetical protein
LGRLVELALGLETQQRPSWSLQRRDLIVTNISLRRIGVSLVGLASAVFLAVGCSSDSNGNPPAGFNPGGTTQGGGGNQGGGGGGQSGGGGQANGGTSAPAGGSGDFCTDFKSIGNLKATDFTSPSRAKKVLEVWDRLAAEAPAPIKSDVQAIDDFLKTVQTGHPDMSKLQKLAQVNEHIITYIAAHC